MIAPVSRITVALVALFCAGEVLTAEKGDEIRFGNEQVVRTLRFDGSVWRTVSFARGDGADRLEVASDEFHLLLFDDRELTLADYEVAGEPRRDRDGARESLIIAYQLRPSEKQSADTPRKITVRYSRDTSPYQRKQVALTVAADGAVDRLEVERFTVSAPASRGGRGQPIFLGKHWFAGLEHPCGHSRHTDGNTPSADSARFEKVGNYSFVGLEERDLERRSRAGLVRLFHFPGTGLPAENGAETKTIVSKTAVVGIGARETPLELAFLDYVATVAKKPRPFLHYNNWYDPRGKNLRGEALVNVWKEFKAVLEPAGVKMDAMAADNGWQNGASLWQPSAGHFPAGMPDVAALGRRLREEGTSLGLWCALDQTTNNIGWGVQQGWPQAKPNRYFGQYFGHQCLADPAYLDALERQLRALTKEGRLSYFKHDFNHLNCLAAGHAHRATDRHGHEANVDGMLRMLAACRDENPDIYQNLTNWVWFSPWWLMHGDALWMLAGDDGFNQNTPEISLRAMSGTDRDTFLWRMWGDASDRPLVPISRLMTHGIVKNAGGQMSGPGDTLADWADYVVMHYGRGTQMKEWYITPSSLKPEEWKVLTSVHRWSVRRFGALQNAVYVGGRPDEGKPFGYVGWDGEQGVLVARNTGPAEQTLEVPFDATAWFRGAAGKSFQATAVYPYHGAWPGKFTSGETMRIKLPGYATIALEFAPGESSAVEAVIPQVAVQREVASTALDATFTIPAAKAARCELLVIGRPNLPTLRVGNNLKATRKTVGAINQFAGYARHGMPSDKAQPWEMAGYDLRGLAGEEISLSAARDDNAGGIEIWLLCDAPVGDAVADRELPNAPFPIANGYRRVTFPIASGDLAPRPPTPIDPALLAKATECELSGEAFGVNSGEFGAKSIFLNGVEVGKLPECGDHWTAFRFPLKTPPAIENVLEIRHDGTADRFKVGKLRLRAKLPNGQTALSARSGAFTSFAEWAHGEGTIFAAKDRSGPITLRFATE